MEERTNHYRRPKLGRPQRNGSARPQRSRQLTKRDLAFAEEGLDEMNRLIEECTQMADRMDELEPRFKQACMQKAWVILISYLTGSLILLLSLVWSGLPVLVFRTVVVAVLVGMYFLPVHLFARGALRADARLVRHLDKRSLANARRAAKIGQSMTEELRKKTGDRKRRFTR